MKNDTNGTHKILRENKIDVTFISWNSKNTSNLKIRYVIIHTFMYHVDYDTSVGGLFVPDGIIRPEVSASALTWFIRYIYLLKFTVPK
jgi:hypothetical protein